jgi:hypothetical protein
MTKEQLIALLGRPLTPVEDANFELYLDIAMQHLEQLICTSLAETSGDETVVYDVREGYRTLFTDVFTELTEVKIDGTVIEPSKYSIRQWDKRRGSWYNSIVFDSKFSDCDDEVEVTAEWGFNTIPSDLLAVLAGLFDLITKKNNLNPSIASKQVEDYRISFRADVDLDADFESKYASTLSKYSMCDIPNVQHGKVCKVC